MKTNKLGIKTLIFSSILMWCLLPPTSAAIDINVEMRLNDAGFISYDHFKAELYMNNRGWMISDATIFGILEVSGEYFFWPSFAEDVDFEIHDIHSDESHILFLEFDFENIDELIPFGPMAFWGAWFLDMETWNYDYQEFWLDSNRKWTPIPTSTPTPTPTPEPGDLFAIDPIVGNMRFIPSGTFTQGSPDTESCRWDREGPQFTHILTRNITVMETEISRQMWALLKVAQPTLPGDPSNETHSPEPNYPVQKNTWYESVLFANLLSLQNGFTPCYYTNAAYTKPVTLWNYTTGPFYCNFYANGYRLPTEGEWEHFARAGTSGPFSCDDPDYDSTNCLECQAGMLPTLEKHCVFCANAPNRTEPVGSKLPNPWNLRDVHGNVWEWCWDHYAEYPTGTLYNYAGPGFGSLRSYRGGGWGSYAAGNRSASRNSLDPRIRIYSLGFRLVRTVSY